MKEKTNKGSWIVWRELREGLRRVSKKGESWKKSCVSDRLYEGWSRWDGKKWEWQIRDLKGCIIGNKWRKRCNKGKLKGLSGV